MMHPIHAARAAGASRYETGKPCPKGHIGPRYVSNRRCVACVFCDQKVWADNNRDYISRYNTEYYAVDPEYHRKRTRDYVAVNSDSIRVKRRATYHSDPAKAMKWARENKDRIREIERNWRVANPEKTRAKNHNRRALKRNAGSHTAQDIVDIFALQKGKCAYCRTKLGKKYHVDHIHALSRGGSNNRDNLQVLCQPCNQSKFTKDPIVFAQSLGMLL